MSNHDFSWFSEIMMKTEYVITWTISYHLDMIQYGFCTEFSCGSFQIILIIFSSWFAIFFHYFPSWLSTIILKVLFFLYDFLMISKKTQNIKRYLIVWSPNVFLWLKPPLILCYLNIKEKLIYFYLNEPIYTTLITNSIHG